MHGGDPGIKHLGHSQAHTAVRIFRSVFFAKREGQREVAHLRALIDQIAQRGVPQMRVCIDQARQNNHLPAVDSFGAGYSKIFPHSDDLASAHVKVAARDISQRRVHCQDLRAPHHKFTAVGKLRRSAVRCSYVSLLRGLRTAAC